MTNEEINQELYACNGCIEQIPTHRARISCHSCPDYHLCANCFVIKQFVSPHSGSHATLVLKKSGTVVPLPPGFSGRPTPALPPRPTIAISTGARQTSRSSEIPTANWGALWNVLKAPLEKKEKRGRKASVAEINAKDMGVEMRDVSPQSVMSGANATAVNELPPSPPKSVRQGIERLNSQAPSYPRPASWEPLFEADSTPTPIFVALMSTIFGHLDPKHTGSLTPEVYSDFLDIQGYEIGSNIWKYAYESDGGEQCKDVADLELGLYYADLNISHSLMVRPKHTCPKSPIDEPSSVVGERIKDSLRFSANMPMLSRQGFIDLGAIEYLKDPAKGHKYLVTVIAIYEVWTELGDVPRNVLPENSIAKEVLDGKIESEPENTVPKVLLAEKLVREEEKEIESESNNGYATEKLSASPSPILPVRVKGGEPKVEALMKEESFDEEAAEIEEKGKTDAMIKISEIENEAENEEPTTSVEDAPKKKNDEHTELYKDE